MAAKKQKYEDILKTNWDMLLHSISQKWISIALIAVLFYLYKSYGWVLCFYFGLFLVFKFLFSLWNVYKSLNKERRIVEIVDYHIKPFQAEWLELEKLFDGDLFEDNEEFSNDTQNRHDDISRIKVKNHYDEIQLDLNDQHSYYKNTIEDMETIRAKVKLIGNPVVAKSNEMDELHYKIKPIYHRLLETAFLPHPVLYYDDLVGAYNEYYLKTKTYYEKAFNIVNKGIIGEQNTERELKLLRKTNEIDYLDNAVLSYGEKSFETDFLVFSKQGIYSLEVKNIGGTQSFTIRITQDGQWLKVFNNGNIEPMQDVTSQMNYHISMTNLLKKEYENETGKVLPSIQPIYIIGNNDVIIDNQSDLNVFRPSYFVHFLRKQPHIESHENYKEFMNWLKSYRIPAKKYALKDYSRQFEKVAETMTISSNINSYYYEIADKIIEDLKRKPELLTYIQKVKRFWIE
ncbi:NERD domain-containing protein [Bacillus sp. V3]|nr:NERD domain-containing protein [Bacillus sp. V3]